MTSKQTIKYSIDARKIAVLTLARPESANALNSQMALEIKDFFVNLPSDVRVIILTGEGEKAFCAGADLKERSNFSTEQWEAQHRLFREVLQHIMDCPVPVIAAVSGVAYGGGLELALACDFIYAADNAKFAVPEATLGIICGTGGTQTLPRSIGTRRAREMLYTGKPIVAWEALAFGLVNRLFPPVVLMSEVLAVAETIAGNAPLSIAAVKRATSDMSLPLAEGLKTESENYKNLLKTVDCKEGLAAFKEKRKPKFTGG